MISRRSVRIKVLQALYSQFILQEKNVQVAKDVYNQSIKDVVDVNLIYLNYIYETFQYISKYSDQQSRKFLISAEEKQVDKGLLDTTLYSLISSNEQFHKLIKKHKLSQYIQSEYVKKMFEDLISKNEYKEFLSKRKPQTEYNLYNTFFKKILFSNEDLIDYLESYYANIDEDSDLVHFALKKLIKSIFNNEKYSLSFGLEEMDELEAMADQLIEQTIGNTEDYMKIIIPKLKGWDAERIPILDMLIIQMAMTEMLYFPTIPLKVTVNEYIDLTKLFCSVKSKDFINGIVDRIMRDYQYQGKIKKSGRGLE